MFYLWNFCQWLCYLVKTVVVSMTIMARHHSVELFIVDASIAIYVSLVNHPLNAQNKRSFLIMMFILLTKFWSFQKKLGRLGIWVRSDKLCELQWVCGVRCYWIVCVFFVPMIQWHGPDGLCYKLLSVCNRTSISLFRCTSISSTYPCQ